MWLDRHLIVADRHDESWFILSPLGEGNGQTSKNINLFIQREGLGWHSQPILIITGSANGIEIRSTIRKMNFQPSSQLSPVFVIQDGRPHPQSVTTSIDALVTWIPKISLEMAIPHRGTPGLEFNEFENTSGIGDHPAQVVQVSDNIARQDLATFFEVFSVGLVANSSRKMMIFLQHYGRVLDLGDEVIPPHLVMTRALQRMAEQITEDLPVKYGDLVVGGFIEPLQFVVQSI